MLSLNNMRQKLDTIMSSDWKKDCFFGKKSNIQGEQIHMIKVSFSAHHFYSLFLHVMQI